MDRKLNNSLIALSSAGLFLAVALLAGTPVGDPGSPGVAGAQPTEAARDDAAPARGDRRGIRAGRRGLALPYFSFAHGVRRIGG